MQNPRFLQFRRLLLAAVVLTAPAAHAALIAHYTFDVESGGTTPDSVAGGAFATLNGLAINTTVGIPKAGAGALEMSGTGTGAITSNTFAWSNDTRTIAFWWKTKLVAPDPENPEALIPADTSQGTYVSMGGSGTVNGGRFDLREDGNPNGATLRTEVQGGFSQANPAIDDGEWHFITIVVPNATSITADVLAYVNGNTSLDLYASGNNTRVINTITSALVFGDTVITAGGRVPNGFLDDFQLYDEALTATQIQFLYNNPGSVIPEPSAAALGLLGVGALFLRRRREESCFRKTQSC